MPITSPTQGIAKTLAAIFCLPALLLPTQPAQGQASQGSAPIVHFPGVTQKLLQLTGEHDRTLDIPTLSRTESQAALTETDLGSSFEHKGKLVFLFGDSNGGQFSMADTMAFSDSTEPLNLRIRVPLDTPKRFRPIVPPGLKAGAFCVPSYGISLKGTMYVVYTQNGIANKPMKRSYFIASYNDGSNWTTLHQLPNNTDADPRFVNVALEEHDGFVYMFGSGEYRRSSVRLARAPLATFPGGWEFFAGVNTTVQGGTKPVWSSKLLDAVELFKHDEVGELSCAWIEPLKSWVMLYNCLTPNGIVMRTAPQPWGPWSEPVRIMDPFRDGYGQFMHVTWDHLKVDLFSDPRRERRGGGVYGPYIIKRFATGNAERCGIYYTMSTWNPYQVVLMGSLVGRGPLSPAPESTDTLLLTNKHWKRHPSDVANTYSGNGRNYINTHSGNSVQGDKKVGWLWQKVPGSVRQLKFFVGGGHSEVYLTEGGADLPESGDVADVARKLKQGVYGRLLLRATGVNSNAIENEHTWDLRRYGGNPLKLVVLDTQTGPWGFVAVSDIEAEVAH